MLKAFRKTNITDRNLSQMQDNIHAVIFPIVSNPILDGRIIKEITLASGSNSISNPLGRNIVGYFVTKSDANVNVWGTTSTPTLLTLNASATATVDLYVF